MTPFFSVIIPTYNRADKLPRTLQSVLAQDFKDFEVLIIDDGSTDSTPLLFESGVFSQESKIRYFRKKNEERSVARNFGFERAKGAYTVFFDSDDYMHPNHLSTYYEAVRKVSNARFLTTKFQFNHEGKIFPAHTRDMPEGFYGTEALIEGNRFGSLICIKNDGRKVSPFPPEFNICEDWIFNFMNFKESPLYLIDSVTVTVDDHPGRSMADNKKVSEARLKATDYLLLHLDFSDTTAKQLRGYTYGFCAVHAYLDGERSISLTYWNKCRKLLGLKTASPIRFVKYLLGRNIVKQVTRLLP